MLLLTEEVGELAKAIRKFSGLKIDESRAKSYPSLKHELADVLFYTLDLANTLDVSLFEAFCEKEQLNHKRTWK